MEERSTKNCYWLILSYRANIDGSACSHHIDDRLPHLQKQGVTPVLLTGPVGDRFTKWIHYRSWSIAPSGIRFELRHFLRKRCRKSWQLKLIETLLLLPVYPLYLLEKIVINLESEWSWFFVASIRGYFLCHRFKPEAVYSTGGTASAHVAAGIICRLTGIPWLAETQDPLVHDHDWQRGRLVLRIYRRLERQICRNVRAFVFLTEAARLNSTRRTQMPTCGRVIYPGANPSLFQHAAYRKGARCHFAHFGTLAGSRNLVVFCQALHQVLQHDPVYWDKVRVDVYGSLDTASKKAVEKYNFNDLLTYHGTVSRKEALRVMQGVDCLLLIQNAIFFSSETIPSKVYEYLLSGRFILGLIHYNEELDSMLRDNGHYVAPADNTQVVAVVIQDILSAFENTDFILMKPEKQWTVADAVARLIAFSRQEHAKKSLESPDG